MVVETIATLPDGRRYNLTLEPKFDRLGYNVTNFVLHAIEEVTEKQLELGGSVSLSERVLRLIDSQ